MGSVNRLKNIYSKLTNIQPSKYGCIDLAKDDVVFISGSGRSGTSWLANICNYKNDFRYIFEPLNPSYIEDKNKLQWCLTNDMQSVYLRKVLEGKVSNNWVNSRNKKIIANRRLIKEIRSNFMLIWIAAHYPKTKIILLLRNPIAIARSRKLLENKTNKGSWVWHPTLSELLANSEVLSRISSKQRKALTHQIGRGIEMESVAEWCIYNLVACDEKLISKVHLVYYENLLANTEDTVQDLMNYIDIPMTDSIIGVIGQKSETTRGSQIKNQTEINDFGATLSNELMSEAQELLQLFNYSRFYTDNGMPSKRFG